MPINIFLLAFVIILGIIMGQKDDKKRRGSYIIFCSILLLFIGSFRSPDWFTYTYNIDTAHYADKFSDTFDMGWDEFWAAVFARYVGLNDDTDIGFVALEKLISLFTHDFQFYSLLVELLFFIPFGLLLYRYSTAMRQIVFAYVFYIALVQIYILGGARQMYAIGLDILAVMAMIDGKKIRSVLLVLLGATIHFSSLLTFIPLFAIWLDINAKPLKAIHAASFLLVPIVFMNPNLFIGFMTDAAGLERYNHYDSELMGGGTTFIVLLELLSLFIFISINYRELKSNKSLRAFYIMAPLFTLFCPLIRSNGTMSRITLYFYLYVVLLFPYGMDVLFKKQYRALAYVCSIAALTLLILINGLEYYFVWQR